MRCGRYKKWYSVDLNPKLRYSFDWFKEGIMHICMTYLNKGDEVLVPIGYPHTEAQ
jgi:hypothetical protein